MEDYFESLDACLKHSERHGVEPEKALECPVWKGGAPLCPGCPVIEKEIEDALRNL